VNLQNKTFFSWITLSNHMDTDSIPNENIQSNERFDVYLVGNKHNRIFAVDRNRCKGCKICTSICPYNAIFMGKVKSHRGFIYPIENGKCTACKQCVYICPDFALSIHDAADITEEAK